MGSSRERSEYEFVLERDGGCIAPLVWQEADGCSGPLERQHVKDEPGTRLRKNYTDREHLVILCRHHHQDGWGTSKIGLALQRSYLSVVNSPGGVWPVRRVWTDGG